MKDFSAFIADLTHLIACKSTCGKPTSGAPFGAEIRKALNYFLKTARSFGFETVDYDGYAGEVRFGEGEEVGIIGHLDVVPVSLGWNTDPWTLTEVDGVYYGRGVSDDKTPLLCCLYALKELKDSGVAVNKKFRLFVGCDEETGWRDVDYLNKKTNLPEYGFSPDGNFPLSYAEKGITVVNFTFPALKNFYDIKGGTVVNAVCDYAQARARKDGINKPLLEKHGLTLRDGNLIESFGKAAHGSSPHLGKNAIKPLLEYFLETGENLQNVIDCLFNDIHGVGKINNEQGSTTFSPDIITEKNGLITISCDCRIPAPLGKNDILPVFDRFGINYTATEKHPSVLVEKDGWFVKTLLASYNSVTGESGKPISLGGSTFSRAFKKGCAFGPQFEGHNDRIHDANENAPKENILKCYEIYKSAIFALAKK